MHIHIMCVLVWTHVLSACLSNRLPVSILLSYIIQACWLMVCEVD